ncbi:MAG: hypothetical protein RL184_1060, partial [Pseudomonadota bacterium]
MVGVVGSSPIEPTNDREVKRCNWYARCAHLVWDERAFLFIR